MVCYITCVMLCRCYMTYVMLCYVIQRTLYDIGYVI